MEELEIRYDEDRGSESLRDKIMSTSALKEALNVLITMFRELRACETAYVLQASSILEPIASGVLRHGTDLHRWLINDLTHVGSIKISFSRPDRNARSIHITISPEDLDGSPPHNFRSAEFVLIEDQLPAIMLHRISFEGRWYS